MSKKVIFALLVAGAIILAYSMRHHFFSHETRIRWRFQEMADAFNAGSAFSLSGYLAEDFSLRKSAIDRRQAIGILRAVFTNKNNQRDDESFLFRAEIVSTDDASSEHPIEVQLKETDPPTASYRFRVRFYRLPPLAGSGEPEKVEALVEFDGTCLLEDSRWRVLEVGRKTLEGRLPFR